MAARGVCPSPSLVGRLLGMTPETYEHPRPLSLHAPVPQSPKEGPPYFPPPVGFTHQQAFQPPGARQEHPG